MFFSIIHFCSLDQILKIKNFHKVVVEHPKVVYGRQLFCATDVLDPDEAAEDGVVDDYCSALDEEY